MASAPFPTHIPSRSQPYGAPAHTGTARQLRASTHAFAHLRREAPFGRQPSRQELEEHPTLAQALAQGDQRRDALLRQTPTLSLEEAAKALHMTNDALHTAVARRQLLALPRDANAERLEHIPTFQISEDRLLDGLQETLRELPDYGWYDTLDFFLSPHDRLEGATPAEALRQGQHDTVLLCARQHWQHVST